jgi:hypothetical protein
MVAIQAIDESRECPYWKSRILAMWEAHEAMEDGVSVRENGYPVSIA